MLSCSKLFLGHLTLLTLCSILILIDYSSINAQHLRLRSQVTPVCPVARDLVTGFQKFADIFADGNIAVQGGFECNGAFIYDISNLDAPVLASWYNPGNTGAFIEAIVVGNRGYFGSGYGNMGVHIVDLTDPYNPVLLGTVDATHGNGFANIHEMMVWGNYLIENNQNFGGGGLRFINISDPTAPVFKWTVIPNDPTWVHAMHIRGNRMYTSGWGGQVEIFDLSNIDNQAPTRLGAIMGNTNNHSTWTSEDGNYLYSCRELLDGDLRVYDVRDPAQPLLIKTIKAADLGLNAVSPHNPVVMGNYLYVSWYQAGLQVFDISSPADPKWVAEYDTFQPTFASPVNNNKLDRQRLLYSDPWDVICGVNNFKNLRARKGGKVINNALPNAFDGNWAIYPFLGQNKILAGDMTSGLMILDATAIALPLKNHVSDFDGDGKTDFSIFRPTTGVWQIETSSNNYLSTSQWGQSGDIMVPGDYDGDGKADLGLYRPSEGTWYIERSSRRPIKIQFGLPGDIPVPADYDADGKTDIAVFRPSNGTWYILRSTLGLEIVQWGQNGDKPITGDFDGDGKIDIAIWRPSDGVWHILQSSSSVEMTRAWGTSGDKPVSADFDGNGITDFAFYRPSEGTWYILDPATGKSMTYHLGAVDDIPIPADYDGDSKADPAVFRPSTNEWFRINSSDGLFVSRAFGQSGDKPSPASAQPQ